MAARFCGRFFYVLRFSLQDFSPRVIYIDPAVKQLPLTQSIIAHFPHASLQEITDRKDIKKPALHTQAKKDLYLTTHKGRVIKSCQGMGDYVCCNYFTMSLISDCHLECTYCILQDYLKNNPVITIFVNTDDVFSEISAHVSQHPEKMFRIGTGELSDSLALDHITHFSKEYVRFAREHANVILELKTKTHCIEELVALDHQKRTVVSWSVNPQSYIDSDEHKCSSLQQRLDAARRLADCGYPVAFNLDPLLYLDHWQEKYAELIQTIGERFSATEIAWMAVGSLRFTPDLKKISQERFTKSQIMAAEFVPSLDGKIRYFRPLREEMYDFIMKHIEQHIGQTPKFLCMETKAVWKNVMPQVPQTNEELEAYLVQNFPLRPELQKSSSPQDTLSSFQV